MEIWQIVVIVVCCIIVASVSLEIIICMCRKCRNRTKYDIENQKSQHVEPSAPDYHTYQSISEHNTGVYVGAVHVHVQEASPIQGQKPLKQNIYNGESYPRQNIYHQRLQKQYSEQGSLENQSLLKESLQGRRLEEQRLEEKAIEQRRLEEKKLEQRRLEEKKLEQLRLEEKKLEQRRLEEKKLEQLRLEEKKLEQRRLEEKRLEQQRLEEKKLEQQRLEEEQLEQLRFEKILEKIRLQNQILEEGRLEIRKLELQRLEKERLEQETKQLEQQKLNEEQLEKQHLRGQIVNQQFWVKQQSSEDDSNDDKCFEEEYTEDECEDYNADNRRGRSRERNVHKTKHRSEFRYHTSKSEFIPQDKRLDLHYLLLDEAMNTFILFLRTKENEYHNSYYRRVDRFIQVITGRGVHSRDRIPKIQPRVQKYLEKNNYTQEWKNNGGMVIIDLLSKRRDSLD